MQNEVVGVSFMENYRAHPGVGGAHGYPPSILTRGLRTLVQCLENVYTVEEEKDFGGGLTAWGGRNLAEGGGEDGYGGEREREREVNTRNWLSTKTSLHVSRLLCNQR
ncbi:hypothetical protein ACLB2K_050688 [Fragaria x ananassa]